MSDRPSTPLTRFVSSPAVVVAVLLAASFLFRLGTLRRVALPTGQIVYYHLEWDEMVFQTLVEQVQKSFFNYTLRGTPLLAQLNPQNYDLPIFFHPPAFVYTARILSVLPLPLVPVAMSLATILLVFFIGRRLYDDERALWASLLVAACPVLWFVSQKLWLDNMVILMITASVAAVIWATDVRRPWAYAVAGAVFGVAFLSKAVAPVILLALATLVAQRDAGDVGRKAAAFAVPALAMIGAWEWILYTRNGEWLPSAYPNAEMIAAFPFVADAVARPWYFYFANLVAITPVYLLALGTLRHGRARDLAPALWCAVFFVAMTGFGLRGGGYQTRYVAPAYPALALLAAGTVVRCRTPGLIAVAGLVGYGMMNAVLYAVLDTPHAADFQQSIASMAMALLRDVARLDGHAP